MQSIETEQKPSAQLLVQRMVPVAHRRLRHLRDQRLGIAQQQVQHRCPVELVLDHTRFQAQALAGALHDRAAGRGLAAHEQRDADDALVADHSDLGRSAIFHDVQQRDDGSDRKVHMAQRAAGLVKHLSQRHFDQFELWLPALPLCVRQCGEQMVPSWVGCSRHLGAHDGSHRERIPGDCSAMSSVQV